MCVCVRERLTGQKTRACQLLKSHCQNEGESDKISHKNSSLVISHFLLRLALSTEAKP